jgi:hypothetical protein
MRKDPNEWTNLAGKPEFAKVLAEHKAALPKVNRKPAPGSKHRVLVYKNGQANWEEQDISPKEPIPEL